MGMETIGYAAMALIGGMAAGAMQSKPNIPPPQAPTPAPQAAQMPDASSVRQDMQGTGQAGGSPGVAETLLTGPGGIDPSQLKTQRPSQTLLAS